MAAGWRAIAPMGVFFATDTARWRPGKRDLAPKACVLRRSRSEPCGNVNATALPLEGEMWD